MRRWITLLGEAGTGLVRNMWMTVAVILSVAVSLTLVGASVLLRAQVNRTLDTWVDEIEVSVFLCNDAADCPPITPDQQNQLREDLEASTLVEEVLYESPEEAYRNFVDQVGDVEAMLEALGEQDLPPSFRVNLIDPLDAPAIKSQFQNRPGVLQISNQLDIIEPYLRAVRVIQLTAFGIAVIQMVAATLLVGNTVRVAAVARREQTQIMKLVGAANWYIRLPFILEGVLAGLVGAGLAYLALVFAVPMGISELEGLFQFVPFIERSTVYGVWPWLVLPAIAITGLSSAVALRGSLDV